MQSSIDPRILAIAAQLSEQDEAVPATRRVPFDLAQIATGLIALCSLAIGLFRIERLGTANAYYAAAVRSMTESWHAFFFAAFDSEGFVTVDKPPLGLWIQALFAKALGFHGWSILLPQVLAATGSVLLISHLVRKSFGPVAGLIAAASLAVTPITVAASRNNTSDTVLVFVLLLATWALLRSIERNQMRWFVVAMALVGVGFNIKMMQAYLVLPAFVMAWTLAPEPRSSAIPNTSHDGLVQTVAARTRRQAIRNRFGGLVLGTIVLLIVSFSWATVVQLIPDENRPYIGSTGDNNIFSLIFEYNGINRLIPEGWSVFGITNGDASNASTSGRGGVGENGPVGIFRLLDTNLGGQIGWLIPIAVIGLIVAWGWRQLWRIGIVRTHLILWGMWFFTMAVFFSVAGYYHRYYLTMLGPAIAALTGIGLVALWRAGRNGGPGALLLPATLIATVASQIRLLQDYPEWADRLTPWIVGATVFAAIPLSPLAFRSVNRRFPIQLRTAMATLGIAAILIAPATWSTITSAEAATGGSLPVAGPDANSGDGGMGSGTSSRSGTSDDLLAYLIANKGDAKWLVAVSSANSGTSIILESGQPVMALGGFKGSDPILTVEKFQQLVANGDVRFVLTSSGAGGGSMGGSGQSRPETQSGDGPTAQGDQERPSASGGSGTVRPSSGGGASQNQIFSWVESACTQVTDANLSTTSLYDCSTATT